MADFYKMKPAVWDARTAHLTLEEEAAYLRICNAIYTAERGCPDHDRVLAGMFRCSTRKARSLVERLIEAEKIYRKDGELWNKKSEREIEQIYKKKGKPEANPTPNDDETDANPPRVDGETDANDQRNGSEQSDKSLKSVDTSHGSDPPLKEKSREDESRPDQKEIAFEGFWKSYPRRRQECGALTRGSKQAARKLFLKLSAKDRDAAINGLPGFARIYPDGAKNVCDAVRYISNERWHDAEGLDETPDVFVPFPDGPLGEKVREFEALIKRDKYLAWFVDGGASRFREEGGVIFIDVLGDYHAQRIKEGFAAPIRKIFGEEEIRFHVVKKKAA